MQEPIAFQTNNQIAFTINKILDNTIYILIGFWLILRFFEVCTSLYSYPLLQIFQHKATNVLNTCFVLYFLYKLLFEHRCKIHLILCLLFVIVSYFLYKLTKTPLVFDLFFIPLFMCQFLSKERFYKVVVVSILFFSVTTFILFCMGYLHSPEVFTRSNGKIRYYFGFIHPNLLGCTAFLLCLYIILIKKNLSLGGYFLLALVAIFCYIVPNSITSSVLVLLSACICFFIKHFYRENINAKAKYKILSVFLAVVIGVLVLNYYITFTGAFKTVLQNMPGSIWSRFELSKIGYDLFGFSLFGKYFDFYSFVSTQLKDNNSSQFYLVLDCAYFYLPIIHGIIVYFIYIGMLIYCLCRSILKNEYLYASLFVVIVLYGVSETIIFRSFMMPLFAYTFFKNSKS